MSQSDAANTTTPSGRRQPPKRSIFDVPAPIKQLFDRFPLLTYSTNHLPHRAPNQRKDHVLYVFTTDAHAAQGAPSFNPACLKWQVRSQPAWPFFRCTHAHPTHRRHTSSSPRYPFASRHPITMHRQVARYHLYYPLLPSRTNRHSQYRQGSCKNGP